jgi:hypothetical protein
MSVILATWEAEIRRIVVQGQLGHETPSQPIIAGHSGTHLSSQATQDSEIRIVAPASQTKNFVRPHINGKRLGVVACATQPCEGRKLKIRRSWFKLAQAKNLKPCLKNDHSKKGWRCGSSRRVPSLPVQNPEFKHHYVKKKKSFLAIRVASIQNKQAKGK